ncbi:MAG: carbohydrate kinase family protein [Patescibacteria group bacterium]
MERKKVLVGFSGNPEYVFAGINMRDFLDNKKSLAHDYHEGVGGTSVNVVRSLILLEAPVFTKLLVSVSDKEEDDMRNNLLRKLTRLDLEYHPLQAMVHTNLAFTLIFDNEVTKLPGLKSKYLHLPIDEIGDQVESFQPDICIASGVVPWEIPLAKTLFGNGSENILNPRKECFEDREQILPLLRLTNMLVLNESELLIFNTTASQDWRKASSFDPIFELGPSEVIITCGKNGSYYGNHDGFHHHQPAIVNDKVVDYTGIGDCYLGGFLTKRLEGASIEDCMRFAAAVASMKVELVTGSNVPRRKDVEQLLAS